MNTGPVVSNDEFEDYLEQYPWIEDRRVPLMIINVTADDGSFDGGTVHPGSTLEITFNEAGEIPYYFQFRGAPGGQDMSGIITVTSS